jgi:hypothetical protein
MKQQLTLGQFIFLLERANPEAEVQYDFCGYTPSTFDSYRGFYEQLALGVSTGTVRVRHILSRANECLGKTFQGYKGGDYTMADTTPLWVANYRECHDTAIVGVIDCDWRVIIETAFQQ